VCGLPDEIGFLQLRHIFGANSFQAILEVSAWLIAIDQVMIGVDLEAHEEKSACQPLFCSGNASYGAQANLCVQMIYKISVETNCVSQQSPHI
jgi:hypothetical protein